MLQQPNHILASTRPLDARFITHDGPIWPVERERMTSADAIRERMADDLVALVRQRGEEAVIDVEDLMTKGWLPDQVLTHGNRAAARASYRLDKQAAEAHAAASAPPFCGSLADLGHSTDPAHLV